MDAAGMNSFLEIGETIAVEFKRCGNGIENDLYEKGCLERVGASRKGHWIVKEKV